MASESQSHPHIQSMSLLQSHFKEKVSIFWLVQMDKSSVSEVVVVIEIKNA